MFRAKSSPLICLRHRHKRQKKKGRRFQIQLKYIELQGFKSFPDKTVISFGDGITAIVGPNGSGKSNIADAVRWVMGETSSKTLRGQKMEDVIFDGTAMRKPLGFAEVSLVLDNTDRTLDIEYDEVAITRRYYRSGESEYFINRSDVRLRDIQELLRDTGLGKTGYSIIGQGAITEIIAAKSADRRVLFEEAAGISKFKHKKDESVRRLAQTQDNITRIKDITSELEARLGPLEKQSQKARKYLALREERMGLELTLWTNRLDAIKEILANAEKQTEELRASYEKTELDLQQTETKVTELSAQGEALTAEIERIRAKNKEKEEIVQQKKAQILVAENDISHAKKDIEKMTESLGKTDEDAEKNAVLEKAHLDEIAALEKKLAEKDAELGLLEKEAAEAEAEKTAAAQTETQINAELAKLNDSLTFLKVRLGSLEQAEQTRSEYIKERSQDIEDAKARMKSIEASRAETEKKIADAKALLQENENVTGGYDVKLKSVTEKLTSVRTELGAKASELDKYLNRRQILSDMEKHYEGFQNSVKAVMTESSRGTLLGIEGTVSELIEVPAEYTTAVETALGGTLQNIVTTDERSAKNAIALLKNRNQGRATFLPLSNVRGERLRLDKLENEYGFVGLAVDLVTYDKKYDGVMTSLLGKTVVCDDLDCATAIAKKNGYAFRFVTLDGQLVNAGGSLTGGSAARNFGILSRRNEIEELAALCEKLEKTIDGLEEREHKLTAEKNSVEASVEGVLAESRRLETELVRLNGDAAHYREYAENMAQQESLLKRELESLAAARGREADERVLLEKKSAETEKEIAAETEKLSANASQTRQADAALAENTEKKHGILLSKADISNSVENISAQIARLHEEERLRCENAEKIRADIKTLEEQIYAYEQVIIVLNSELEDFGKESAADELLIGEKIAARAHLEQQANTLRRSEKDLYDIREKLSREIEKQSTKLEGVSEEKETLTSKIWEEYELTLSEAREHRVEIDDVAEAQKKVSSIRASMKALGEVNLGAVDEYIEVKERYDRLSEQVNDLVKAKEGLEKVIDELTARMKDVFKEQFKVINEEFEKVFRELFNGGSAKLELEDPENILESGIDIYVAPPGKIIKHLSSLSGGEQSLTAIALYFAILTIRPAPFCLLDEIEAALDDVNVVRYAEYLHRHDKTQFIVITHRRGTMEAANRLYGVTMKEKGISRILAIDVSEIEKHI